MKTRINKQGFDFSEHGDFGNLKEKGFGNNEFLVSVSVLVPVSTIIDQFFYRVTYDGYLQIARWSQLDTPFIIAQFIRNDEPIKEQILRILKEGVKDNKLFTGSAMEAFEGGLISVGECNNLLKSAYAESSNLSAPEDIEYDETEEKPILRANGVVKTLELCYWCNRFYARVKKDNKWEACPRGCKPLFENEEYWQETIELEKKFYERREKNEKRRAAKEVRMNAILEDLRLLKTEQERIDAIAWDIKSGRNKYKEASDFDVNLIFQLLFGFNIQELEREQEVLSLEDEEIRQRLIMEYSKEDALEIINEVLSSHLESKKLSISFEKCDDLDYIDIDLCIKNEDEKKEFYEAYIEWDKEEQISVGNYYEITRVSLESSDGFVLNYVLDWTEGEPHLGMVRTPYSEDD